MHQEVFVKITEIRVTLKNEDKLKAYANVTFDDAFVIHGLKVINGVNGFFVSMPSRRRSNGSHQDIAHPINKEMRDTIEQRVLEAYREVTGSRGDRSAVEQDPV